MKRTLNILFTGILFAAVLTGCKPHVGGGTGTGGGGGGGTQDNPIPEVPSFESQSVGSRAKSLDFIFNNRTLGTTTIKMRRSEWNQLLTNFDYFYKNENLVKVEEYLYEKDGKTWTLNNCGIRLRGNTSRFKPQGKSSATDKFGHTQMNADWSQDYYEYVKDCPDTDYRQAHFKVDFEPEDGQEQKMAGCMKGVALKRNDGSYARELLCYDVFRKNGIWTAPRASHTRVLFNFIEDVDESGNAKEDISECIITSIDYGVYEMFEEVNKQSLKARSSDEINGLSVWSNNKGDLWKCAGGDLTNPDASMYAEDVRITEFDANGIPLSYIWDSPTYDLKTNKEEVDRASNNFRTFIRELKELSLSTPGTSAGTKARKTFYEKWFDMDLFIKTYAINVMVGMDDDYWGNANNYYLYFDNGSKGTKKCYLIPFDYDNTLGNSIKGTGAENNVMDWGQGANRPLLDRMLEVPEYSQMYKNYLKLVSDYESKDSAWNVDRCKELVEHWHSLVEPYYSSPDLWHEGRNISPSALWISDDGGYNASKYYLTHEPYYYVQMHENILKWTMDPPPKITFNLNGGTINGKKDDVTKDNSIGNMKLSEFGIVPKREGYTFVGWGITKDATVTVDRNIYEYVYAIWEETIGIMVEFDNIPTNSHVRQVFVNGNLVSETQNNSSNEKAIIFANVWVYPYTEAGKTYEVYARYLNSDWITIDETKKVTVVAKNGIGENSINNSPVKYTVTDNYVEWVTQPDITVCGQPLSESNNPGRYSFGFQDNIEWTWYAGREEKSVTLSNFDVKEYLKGYFASNSSWNKHTVQEVINLKNLTDEEGKGLYLTLIYEIPDSKYGKYRIGIDLSIPGGCFNIN